MSGINTLCLVRTIAVLAMAWVGTLPVLATERAPDLNSASTPVPAVPTVPTHAATISSVLTADQAPSGAIPLHTILTAPPEAGAGEAMLLQGGGTSGPQLRYYALDALGSVRVTFDAAGNVIARADYEPFGAAVPASTTGTQPRQQFTGHERDGEVGVDYFGARFYLSSHGRMPSVDPLHVGAVPAPQRWNRYAYALNAPTGVTDPDGRNADHCDATFCSSTTGELAASELTAWLIRIGLPTRPGGGSGSSISGDFGGNGGGDAESGQTPVDPKTNAILQKAVDEIIRFDPSTKCEERVISQLPDHSPGNRGPFELGSFKSALGRGASFFDGRNDNRSLAGTVYPETLGTRALGTIANSLRVNALKGTVTVAQSSVVTPTFTVYLGSAALSGSAAVNQSPSRAFGFVFHEALHWFLGQDDGIMMRALGLKGSSVEISNHITKNCR